MNHRIAEYQYRSNSYQPTLIVNTFIPNRMPECIFDYSECIETVNYTIFFIRFPHDWRQFQFKMLKCALEKLYARSSLSLTISHTYCFFHNVSAHFMISLLPLNWKARPRWFIRIQWWCLTTIDVLYTYIMHLYILLLPFTIFRFYFEKSV